MASVYYTVLQAVAASVRLVPAVNAPDPFWYTGGGLKSGPIPVNARKKPLQLETTDPLPQIICWPGEQGEKRGELQFKGGSAGGTGGVWWGYPIVTALVTAGNRLVSVGLQQYLDLREQIRDQLFSSALIGTSTVFDFDTEPQEVFDLQAFLGGNYDVTGFQGYYTAAGSRVS